MTHNDDAAGAPAVTTSAPQTAAVSVDIGGTKIAAGLIDADGRILHQLQVPTPAHDGPDAILGAALAAASGSFAPSVILAVVPLVWQGFQLGAVYYLSRVCSGQRVGA